MNFGNPANFAKYQLQQRLKSTQNYQLYEGNNKIDKTNVLVYVLPNVNKQILERLLKLESGLIQEFSDLYLIEPTAYVVYTLSKNETFLLEYLADNEIPEEFIWDWLELLALYYEELTEKGFMELNLDMSLFALLWADSSNDSPIIESTPTLGGSSNSTYLVPGTSALTTSASKMRCKLVYYGACMLYDGECDAGKAAELNREFDVLILGKFISGCISKYVLSELKQETSLAPQDQYYESLLPSTIYCSANGSISQVQSEYYSQILLKLLSYTQLDYAERISLPALLSHPMLATARDAFNILSYNTFEVQDFDIERKIGEGGFGVVELARHRFSNQLVVLKSSARVGIERKEANLLRNLSHPNVVRLYGDFADRNIYYIAIEYCESGDLLHFLEKQRKVPKELQLPWIAQICSALYYMHSQSLMHRDIKPENILISNNELYITDFGISKEISSETNTIIGTPMYFAPEVYKHVGYAFPADVYSLGLVIYNMLTGEHIYKNTPKDQADFFNSKQYEREIEEKMVFVSRQFRTLVFNMLKYTPTERPTMEEICGNALIQQYLIEAGLPGVQQNQILMSPRAKRPNIDLTALFAREGGGIEAMYNRLVAEREVLGDYFEVVVRTCGCYIRSSLGLPKTAFGTYLCQEMELEVEQMLKDQGLIQFIFKDEITDAQLEADAEVYLYVGSAFKYKPRAKRQIIFAVLWNIDESMDIEGDVCIVVSSILFLRSVQIKLSPHSVLAVQKIETNKHYKITGGTIYSDVCGLSPSQKPFDTVFSHSQQLQALGEYANHSFPMLFKDNRGYWRNDGVWNRL